MQTPDTAIPYSFSTLFMLFHVSPIHKCISNDRRGEASKERPQVSHTSTDETVLKIPIEDQMIGNAMGGGVQLGRFRVFLSSASDAIDGRRLSNIENTRERKLRNKNRAETSSLFGIINEDTLDGTMLSTEKAMSHIPN